MKTLLQLQDLDLRIEVLKAREAEIPKQKSKFDIHKKRLADELVEREKIVKVLQVEQRECEIDMEQKQTQIKKYDQQLFAVKKNDEYQALLHEIDMIKKQVALKEERVISIMVEIDESKARLDEDKKRVSAELKEIEQQCAAIDAELGEAVLERERIETERPPLEAQVEADLLARYDRIRRSKKTGAAVVPLNNESCSGCFMKVPPQTVNELLEGNRIHACNHCGRLLYHKSHFE